MNKCKSWYCISILEKRKNQVSFEIKNNIQNKIQTYLFSIVYKKEPRGK